MPFEPLAQYPDHLALEEEVLAWWDAEAVFDQLRERNRGGPTFSFMDGPITANNPMGAHHCWGRTLKDVFQRYKALRGFDQRYQNGFDCQGLWVEVGVERALGLNSKREIEEYGLAEFNERCKERVAEFAEVITEQCRRLGMWMDWDNDYYTFSDTNIEYIWRFLKECHDARLALQGTPLRGVVPPLRDLALAARADQLLRGAHASLALRPVPAQGSRGRVAGRLDDDAVDAARKRRSRRQARRRVRAHGGWGLVGGRAEAPTRDSCVERAARSSSGSSTKGRSTTLPAQEGVVHRVIPWDDVTLSEGTGIVHIAPGCGAEDFELSRVHDLPVLMPINEAGTFYEHLRRVRGPLD